MQRLILKSGAKRHSRVLGVGLICLFFFLSTLLVTAKGGQNIDESSQLSDEELILIFASQAPRRDDAEILKEHKRRITLAAKEIFKRGERMIPRLMTYRGNANFFESNLAGRSDYIPANATKTPSNNDGTYITVEVAALYLISSIHYGELEFAREMYLDDGTCVSWSDYNKPEKVARAWESTEQWVNLLNEKGAAWLSKNKINPLKGSGMNWIGDGGKYKGTGLCNATSKTIPRLSER